MKRTTCFAAVIAAAAMAGIAAAGTATYSIDASASQADLGETITFTVNLALDPQGAPFHALGGASFNVIGDDIPAGGVVSTTGPGVGLHPSFISLGNSGTVVLDDIMGVIAGQLPGSFNPGVNTSTSLALYTFTYTVTDATPRTLTFDLSNVIADVYATSAPGPASPYTSVNTPVSVQIGTVPAPGSLALLGAAGALGFGRRRRR